VPIVVLTTEAGDTLKSQGKAAGATGWMVKPFDPSKLLAIAKKLLG
ncbi:MAG TPA: response regulator, partial [Alteromonas sp.]|nr:response regulator [Alteromonas sp.]